MSNEIVKYENRLDDVPLRRFNTREMNLFFSIASRVREKGTSEIELSFNQLRDMSQYKQHGEQFVQDLNQTYHKLLSLNAMTDDGHTITAFVLFTQYQIDRDSETVRIGVNPKFKGMFNELSHWTRFSLSQFASLKSTYSKTMFRLIKRWRTKPDAYSKGVLWHMDEFRRLLDIPKSYRAIDIDARVLKPIKEELTPLFKGFRIKKERDAHAPGRKISGYRFFWKPEAKNADDFSKGEIADRENKLNNVKNNTDLSIEEKEAAVRHIDGIFKPLPKWLKLEKRRAAEPNVLSTTALSALKKQSNEYAHTIALVDDLITKGQRLTAGDKKKLAQLRKLYSSTQQRIKDATKQPQQATVPSHKPADPFTAVSKETADKPASTQSSMMPPSAMDELQAQMQELQKKFNEEQAKQIASSASKQPANPISREETTHDSQVSNYQPDEDELQELLKEQRREEAALRLKYEARLKRLAAKGLSEKDAEHRGIEAQISRNSLNGIS